jgi:serralysin
VLRVFGSGADRLVFEDTGWTPGASSGGFVTFTNGGATVIAAESLVSVVSGPTTGNDTLSGTSGADTIDLLAGSDSYLGLDGNDSILGNDGADTIYGGNGADSIAGGNGEDSLSGGDGNDTLSGDAGNDVAIYSDSRTAYRCSLDDGALIVSGPTGTDRLQGIESLRFGPDAPLEVASLGSMNLIEEMVTINRDGVTTAVLADRYSGPVSWLEYQMLGINGGDVMIGTSRNDFFNLLGGDDAANGGGGDDVLDGGSGSNFLTGGAGRDDFFLDGRGGTITWGTITDWQANERLSVWGWRPGVSTAQWVDSAGATGYTGVTMHGDLDGNGVIDTSMTWSGITAAQLPTPLEFEGLLWFT